MAMPSAIETGLRPWLLAASAALVAACTSVSPDESTPRVASAEPTADESDQAVPSEREIQRVRSLLLARHTSDLPTRRTLDRHPGAEQVLRQLAVADRQWVVRARALHLLGMYSTTESEDLLVASVSDQRLPEKLRAAAIRGLARRDLAARADLREAIVGQLGSRDPMIAVAAVSALRDIPEAAAELERISDDELAPSPAREKAREALGIE